MTIRIATLALALTALPAVALAGPGSQPAKAAAGSRPAAASQPAKNIVNPKGNPDLGPKGTVHRGAPFTLKSQMSLDEVAKDAATYAGKTVKVTGQVGTVCKKKGCWMVLKGTDAAARARITFKDYGFFVPKDGKDAAAVVEGEVEVKALSPEERAHLAEDAGKKVDEIPANELRIIATAVQMERGGK